MYFSSILWVVRILKPRQEHCKESVLPKSGNILIATDQILHFLPTNRGLTKYENLNWNVFLEPSEYTLSPPEEWMFKTEQRSCVKSTVEPTEDQCISLPSLSLHKQLYILSNPKPNKWSTAWFLYMALKSENWPQSVLILLVMPDSSSKNWFQWEQWKKYPRQKEISSYQA